MKKSTLTLLALLSLNAFAAAESQLTCFGTEPFWEINISNNNQMRLLYPGETDQIFTLIQKTSASGTSGDFAFQISGHNTRTELLKLNIIKGNCNDGMSDIEYPYNVMVEHQNRLLYGCCK
jgi:uncharacterized membrane protein